MTEPTLENRPKPSDFHTGDDAYDAQGYREKSDCWFEGYEKKLRVQVENNEICDNCPFRETCENYPYDCDALDALRKLFEKETKK